MDQTINHALATVIAYSKGQTEAQPANMQTVADLCAIRRYLMSPAARSTFPRVANASPFWQNIVNFWDDICVLHDLEAPDWMFENSDAPQTMDMIQSYQPKETEDEQPENRQS